MAIIEYKQDKTVNAVYTNFAALVTAKGSTETSLAIGEKYDITSDLVVPANIDIHDIYKDCGFNIAAGVTLTINKMSCIPNYQVFFGDGNVVFGDGAIEHVNPDMFGAVGDGSTDDLAAFDKMNAAYNSVLLLPKTYAIDGVLKISGGARKWYGSGIEETQIKLLSSGSKVKVGSTEIGESVTYDISVAYFWINGNSIAEIGLETSGDYSPYAVLGHFHDFRVTGCTVAGHRNLGTQGAMFDNFNIRNNSGDGILISDAGTIGITTATVYKRGRVYQNDRGAYINKAWGIGFEGVNFESNDREGVLIDKQDGITCDVISFTNKCWFESNMTGGGLGSANIKIMRSGSSYSTYITIEGNTFNGVKNPESSSTPTGNVHIDYYADNIIIGKNFMVSPSRVPIKNSSGPNQKSFFIDVDQSMVSTNYRVYNATITGTLTVGKFARGITSNAKGRITGTSSSTVSVQRLTDYFTVGETVEEWDTEAAKGAATATFVVVDVNRYSVFSTATTLLNGNGYSTLKGGADIDGNCYVDGTLDVKDKLTIQSATDYVPLKTLRSTLDDGDPVVEFAGSSLGIVTQFVYLSCGTDGGRIGLALHKVGTAVTRIWVDNDGKLRFSNSLPTAHTDGNLFIYAGTAGTVEIDTDVNIDDTTASTSITTGALVVAGGTGVAKDIICGGDIKIPTGKGYYVNGIKVVTDQQTALTTQLTTITHTSPGTPDYAIAAPINTNAYGFTTADEFNTAMSVIANLQTRLSQLETKLKAHGLIA